eukprot:CAMPEP_0203799678 /NCGR_PEP_ID=MMETSP0100_2-20121128/10051_1 /ASSEMBLY_ACC=CAM_ASM_000210 /TAXON_ID=96639 /ORGANISM=" , Strain NY0313808BC1" /LENGTH=225 /DNA_ID=CAMNT_0050705589 /DNA_START=4 /DNA_END=681 /DNA_ORIENTATION=-
MPTPRWLPLESNPQLLNSFLRRMGVNKEVHFTDVYGLDPELLAMVPQPCLAVCLLFPSKTINPIRREQFKDKCEQNDGLFYLSQQKQVGNACGTIACVHCIANCPAASMDESSPLRKFINENRGKDSQTIGENLSEAVEIHEASEQSAHEGQGATPSRDDSVDGHFICFVTVDNKLYELDGMMPGPINHGPTANFLADTAKIIKEQFMALDPENVNFNVTAMCGE